MWAPMRLKPLPGTYWPPTAKAMMEEEFLVKKYWGESEGFNHQEHRTLKQVLSPNYPLVPCFLAGYPNPQFP